MIGLSKEHLLELKQTQPSLSNVCDQLEAKLVKVQSTLLDVGSYLATPRTRADRKQLDRLAEFNASLVEELERWIDAMDVELPVLRNFILPGGGKCAAMLHVSRSVCRRLERSIQPLLQARDLDPQVQHYVNRLSDFLFVAARFAAMKEGRDESVYKKP